MPEPARDRVFISYSHKDKRWLDDLTTHLKPYLREGTISAWSDEHIRPGSKWLNEIRQALAETRVAVLLVTPDFLASDFIHEHELTPLLTEAEAGGVTILWVPVRASSYLKSPIKDYQAVSDPERPLARMRAQRDEAWVEICRRIEQAVNP
jgi:internalin A